MPLLSLKKIYYSVGQFPLLDYLDFEVQPKQRLALIGRNGEGKSTLLKIIAGDITPEDGKVIKEPHIKIARLIQELPAGIKQSVYEYVAQGLQELTELLISYNKLTTEHTEHDEKWLAKLTDLQHKLEHQGGWEIQQRIEKTLQDLDLDPNACVADLSGGWRRRVSLAQALVQQPDILLLDEPTNHLDLEAISWLEKFLLNFPNTIIFITHDRALLRKLATQIVELDRGKLYSYPPDYDKYLQRKAKLLEDEQQQNKLFDKKLSNEEQWIRQGIKARRTRNEGRVRALKKLREIRAQRRSLPNKVKISSSDPIKMGKTVIQVENISFGYNTDTPLIKDFEFNIQRGDKVAIIGANGSGKTTLIKLLLKQLEPQSGIVKHSPTNQIAVFDQNREQLKANETLIDNVAEGDDFVEIQGQRKHIIGYLQDFLFSPQKCRALAGTLSGGEQNRLLLAKLFSKPANLLVLDEPTNDLDIETLEVLENLLLNYAGTVLVISHDREFIDNIATHCIALEKSKKIYINVGGYSDWQLHSKKTNKPIKKSTANEQKPVKLTKPQTAQKKLSFNEQRELQQLPNEIEKLENNIAEIQQQMLDSDFYKQPQDEVKKVQQELSNLEQSLAEKYSRWEELDNI